MKKLCFLFLLFIVSISNSIGQRHLEYFELGKKNYEDKNYEIAKENFSTARSTVSINSDSYYNYCYWYAISMYSLNEKKYQVEIEYYLLKTIFNKHIPSIEFYSLIYPYTNIEINNTIFKMEIYSSEHPELYFYRANTSAKNLINPDNDKAFEFLELSLKNGYIIPENYLNCAIKNLDKDRYYDILLKYNYNVAGPIKNQLKKYVENEVNNWQKKGKYEKSIAYTQRVNELNRELKIKEYTQNFIDSIGAIRFDLTQASNEYDADNEVFKITFNNQSSIYMPVPINEAPEFDKNFKLFKYENAKFTLYNEKFEILHLDIINPISKMAYTFDSKDVIAFNTNQLALNFDEIQIDLKEVKTENNVTAGVTTINVGKSDVDENIPLTSIKKPNKYALIIGNENYKNYQTGLKDEQNVEFAIKDATIFKEYCVKTLGIPAENIIFKTNAGVVQMQQCISQINSIIKNMNGDADVIVYYAGHGFPDAATSEPYLIPVDVSSSSLNMAIPLNSVVQRLTEYPSKKVILFLDACFTGGGRDMGLLASRGVKIVPKDAKLNGNLVVFSASSSEQSALPYSEKRHGLFTYYLLKKLQETNGDVGLAELDEYLSKQVSIKSTIIHSREQNPKTQYSPSVNSEWQAWKLK